MRKGPCAPGVIREHFTYLLTNLESVTGARRLIAVKGWHLGLPGGPIKTTICHPPSTRVRRDLTSSGVRKVGSLPSRLLDGTQSRPIGDSRSHRR